MRFIGIDFGTKRIGLSTGDDETLMAFPNVVVLNTRSWIWENIGPGNGDVP